MIGLQIQKELTYLLAQQFIDGSALLRELVKQENADKDGNEIFYLAAMLEIKDKTAFVKAGEILYPAGVTGHRLYLRNQAGYRNLHLWIRLISADMNGLPENLNLQMERLLDAYREFR